MTTIEHHFPMLNTPPGGLSRLRARLDRSDRTRVPRFAMPAAAALMLLLVSVPWLLDFAQTRHGQSVQIEELRRTLADHRAPPLSIDGTVPRPVPLGSDHLEVYFANASG